MASEPKDPSKTVDPDADQLSPEDLEKIAAGRVGSKINIKNFSAGPPVGDGSEGVRGSDNTLKKK